MRSVFDRAAAALNAKKPFVLYAKPESDILTAFFQQTTGVYYTDDLTEKGFVFSSFLDDSSILFPEHQCDIVTEDIFHETVDLPPFSDNEPDAFVADFHKKLVQNGVDAILSGKMHKVVLSRREEVKMDEDKILVYYKRILEKYPTAFRYLFYHPEVGLWMGATPEQLLKKTGDIIETVALAGTQVYQEGREAHWQPKEQLEQQIVTDFIEESILLYVSDVSKTLPYTYRAGSLVHIKTDIKGRLLSDTDFVKVVKALHPTPALCGFPKTEARDFIVQNEGYPREFYSGFLGEINYDYTKKTSGNSNLFVNLRCMQLKKNTAYLYIGGGITKDSDPQKEFIETINKSKTMKRVLG